MTLGGYIDINLKFLFNLVEPAFPEVGNRKGAESGLL